jgi:hypothetical protein
MKALVKWNGRRFDNWYWVLGIGYWALVISYWLLVIGYWFFLNNRISINACLPAGRIFEVRLD